MSDRFEKTVLDTVRRYDLLTDGESVLLGVSGGADSVSMLFAMRAVFPASSITVCHLNHSLRGEEAIRDEAFVKDLCAKLGVPYITKTVDAAAYARQTKQSVETAARELRYSFFEEICRGHGIRKIATAHTASDNAETVLYNLIRGASIQGLCGIPPRRRIADGIEVIRPLIGVTRADTEAYLAATDQTYVTDSSNLTDTCTRNFIRHRLVPVIREINPSFEHGISENTSSLRDANDCLTRICAESTTDSVEKLCELDRAIAARVIASLCRTQTRDCPLESIHIRSVLDALPTAKREPMRRIVICLPGGYSAILYHGTLSFAKTVRNTETADTAYERKLIEGLNDLRDIGYAVLLTDGEDMIRVPPTPNDTELIGSCVLSRACIQGALSVRSRKDGDVIRLGGQTKKVKRLFNQAALSPQDRSTLPIITDGDGIVFIPPSFLCDKQKYAVCASGKTARILIYRYTVKP